MTDGWLGRIAGHHSDQRIGGRLQMEDRHVILPREGLGLFAAVVDGHGGVAVADRVVSELPALFLGDVARGLSAEDAFMLAFGKMELACQAEDAGATAVCAFVAGDLLTVANCGDSPCLAVGGAAETLSALHRLTDPNERARILAAGGRVADPYFFVGNKGIIPTRSFGDGTMRRAGLTARPHIRSRRIESGDRYVLLASDGLFDVLSAGDIFSILDSNSAADYAVRALLDEAEVRKVKDNVTVAVIQLKSGADRDVQSQKLQTQEIPGRDFLQSARGADREVPDRIAGN
ncbi:protein serine/threonine phosphatase 2C family protein [bacterium]|nr:protein serine/threonine phosphatase 2C family protein [bacterium]